MKINRFFTLLLTVLVLTVLLGVANAEVKSPETINISEADALSTTQEWASLVSQANVSELEKILDDKYIHIHGTALVESKAQFLEAFKNGSRKYDPIKIEDINVRVFGSSAVVTGKFNLKAVVRGKAIEGVNRFGLVLVKTQNGQQVVSFQATAIPQPK